MPFVPHSPPYASQVRPKLMPAEFDRTQVALQETMALAEAAVVQVVNVGSLGSPNAATIQAAINSIPDSGDGVPAARFELGEATYAISTTIEIRRKAIILRGNGSGNPTDHPTTPGKGTTFKWTGAAGQPMFKFVDCQSVVIEDVYFAGNDATPPSELLLFYAEASPVSGGGTNQYISLSRCVFGRLGYVPYAGYTASQRCVAFSGTNLNNDQAWFHNCTFAAASDALVSFDNSNNLWSSFINCFFDGRQVADLTTPTATGLRTAAVTTLYNPQFNRCAPDFDVNGGGQPIVYMYNTENSAQFVRINASGGGFTAIGGAVVAHVSTMGTKMIEAPIFGGQGLITLTGLRVRTAMTVFPKLYVRGNSSSLRSSITVRDCSIPPEAYDVAAGTGTGGIAVRIDDDARSIYRLLLNSATLPIPVRLPLRIGEFISNGSAVTSLLSSLVNLGWIVDKTQTVTAVRTQQLTNPRFASSGSGWTLGTNVTRTIVGTAAQLTATADITIGNSLTYHTTAVTAAAGEIWSGAVDVTLDSSAPSPVTFRADLTFYPAQSVPLFVDRTIAPGETVRFYVDGSTVPASQTSTRLVLRAGGTVPSGTVFRVSNPVVEHAPVTAEFFCGASSITGWTAAWTGTADASTSTLTPS